MFKSLTIAGAFGARRKEDRSIESIKSQARTKPRSYAAIRPFWLYASYVLAAANVAILFSYLLGINASASTGYEIKKIQQKIDSYADQNKKLNLKISEQASIASIQSDFTQEGYVPASGAKFLQMNHRSEAALR